MERFIGGCVAQIPFFENRGKVFKKKEILDFCMSLPYEPLTHF
jgi:hypothetical protein